MTRTVTRHTEAILPLRAGIRLLVEPGHDDEEITDLVEDADDDEPMPPLVDMTDEDMTDDDSPMPALIPWNEHTPVPIWHGPTMMWHGPDAAGPSGGPCRSPAWGFAKPGRQG